MSSGASTATAATMSRLTNDICGIRSHPKSCDLHAVAGLGALSRLSPETSSRYTKPATKVEVVLCNASGFG